ncbi:MAG: bifunctional DNA-formamidopyrimidine glycosylase/DNA-(apurinic or apyrimidinic site) lyase [Pseudomonadota bacterium]|nr:bifunctional DNA-formamidopyrimidine glycosylase/DNA-(apurinic or apyrimidinic site) lyase [Pseudomonadota bacterium]
MPELPEVETVARVLHPHLLGRKMTRVDVLTDKLRKPLAPFKQKLPDVLDKEIIKISRRAKYIVLEFTGMRVMLLHLGMSGSLKIVPGELPVEKHERIIWFLDDGCSLRFHDPRKFGLVDILPLHIPGSLPECLDNLPPEPLGEHFSSSYLHRLSRGRRRPIKSLLMDNNFVVGIGNIYASESLFRAGIRPTKAAGKLSQRQYLALVEAIKQVLTEAIAAGGTTISDFVGLDGTEGRFARHLNVYGRAGEACLTCHQAIIVKSVIAGRSTYYCPHCQR